MPCLLRILIRLPVVWERFESVNLPDLPLFGVGSVAGRPRERALRNLIIA
jgi:hypothetical protein